MGWLHRSWDSSRSRFGKVSQSWTKPIPALQRTARSKLILLQAYLHDVLRFTSGEISTFWLADAVIGAFLNKFPPAHCGPQQANAFAEFHFFDAR